MHMIILFVINGICKYNFSCKDNENQVKVILANQFAQIPPKKQMFMNRKRTKEILEMKWESNNQVNKY